MTLFFRKYYQTKILLSWIIQLLYKASPSKIGIRGGSLFYGLLKSH